MDINLSVYKLPQRLTEYAAFYIIKPLPKSHVTEFAVSPIKLIKLNRHQLLLKYSHPLLSICESSQQFLYYFPESWIELSLTKRNLYLPFESRGEMYASLSLASKSRAAVS